MTKDVMAKAIMLDFQEKMKEVNSKIEKVTVDTFKDMAGYFREAADIVEATAEQLDELEGQDD